MTRITKPVVARVHSSMNLTHKTAILARTELFGYLDEAAQQWLAEGLSEKVFDRGQVIYWQDDPGDRMFLLAEGTVKLYVSSRDGDVIELVRHQPPAVFGEIALLDGGLRMETAEAVERSTLLVMTRPELVRLLRSEELVAEALLRILGAMLRRTTRQLTDLVFLDLEGRVARQLLMLASDRDWNRPRTRQITQGELATMVSGARQTVNQVLRSLEARGFIRLVGGVFEILDREGLQHLAEQ
jgi:CRP/FNR family transcriptional regulator, cyclic AMP receptor protein